MASALTIGQWLFPGRVVADPWFLQTSLGVTGRADDNVFLTESNEKFDFSTSLVPSVGVIRRSHRLELSARYTGDFQLFTHYQKLNNSSHTGRIEMVVRELGPKLLQQASFSVNDSVILTERQATTLFEGDLVGNEGVITEPNNTLSHRTSATFMLPLTSSLQSSISYVRSSSRYESPSLIDSTTQEASMSVSSPLTQRLTLGVGYLYRTIDFEIQNQPKSVQHEGFITTSIVLSPTMDLDLRAGEDYFGDTNQFETVGAATLTKRFQTSEASLGYTRTIASGGGAFSDPTIRQYVTAVITRTMGENASAALTGVYMHHKSTNPTNPGLTESYRLSATVTYTIYQWLAALASYNHLSQRSSDLNNVSSLRNNTFTVALNGTWEKSIP